MSDTNQISETEAIRRVLKSGSMMDYIDVVNEVRNQFHLNVTAAQVEQLLHESANTTADVKPRTRVSMDMVANFPDEVAQTAATQPPLSQPPLSQPSPGQTEQVQTELPPTADLSHALHFVKSVNGLTNAKRALAALESILEK